MEKYKDTIQFLIMAFRDFSGDNRIWLLVPPSIAAILFLSPKSVRLFFAGFFITAFLTIFNPFFVHVVVSHGILTNRYLRFFWILCFFGIIAYAAVLLVSWFAKRFDRVLAVFALTAFILLFGIPVFGTASGYPYQAVEDELFISSDVIELSQLLHKGSVKEPKVLYGGEMILNYRQYDASVISYISRNWLIYMMSHELDQFLKVETCGERFKMICRVYYYKDYSPDPAKYFRTLQRTGINYVISSDPELDAYLHQTEAIRFGRTSKYSVWEIPLAQEEA